MISISLTLEEYRAHPQEIEHESVPVPDPGHVPLIQAPLVAHVILGKDILEVLGPDAAVGIVGRAVVTAVHKLGQTVRVDAEKRIGKVAVNGRIGQQEVDDAGRQQGQRNVPAPFAEAAVGVSRPDHAVAVCVPVTGMLLHNLPSDLVSYLLTRMNQGPTV